MRVVSYGGGESSRNTSKLKTKTKNPPSKSIWQHVCCKLSRSNQMEKLQVAQMATDIDVLWGHLKVRHGTAVHMNASFIFYAHASPLSH